MFVGSYMVDGNFGTDGVFGISASMAQALITA
jgi:hypothetical protein